MRILCLRELREDAGYTQEYVASHVGVKRSAVAQWELGNKRPRADRLPKLASLFECSIDALYVGHETN